jgi:hypothetical protein
MEEEVEEEKVGGSRSRGGGSDWKKKIGSR